MFCFHLVFDDISSDDALQLMLTSPTYFHLEGTAVLTCVGAFECDCRHDAPNIWKNPSSRTSPTPGPTIIDKKRPHTSAITSFTRGAWMHLGTYKPWSGNIKSVPQDILGENSTCICCYLNYWRFRNTNMKQYVMQYCYSNTCCM